MSEKSVGRGVALYLLASVLVVGLAGAVFIAVYSAPAERRTVAVSALVALVVQLVAFAFARILADKGNAIAGLPAETLTCTLETGIGDLDVVYSFSDPATGAGVLQEVCTNNTPLALVSAREPFQRYRIRTRES